MIQFSRTQSDIVLNLNVDGYFQEFGNNGANSNDIATSIRVANVAAITKPIQ